MTSPETIPTTPISYPAGWPEDDLSEIYEMEGEIFVRHPERIPQHWDRDAELWEEI